MQKKTNPKFIVQLIVYVLAGVSINAQSPGLWLRADKTGNQSGSWQDVSGNNNPAYTTSALNTKKRINYNPAVNFSGLSDSLTVNYDIAGKDYLKVFTVFRGVPDSTGEQTIWCFGDISQNSLQLSNKKLYKYPKVYKYAGGDISKPVISIVDRYNSNNPAGRKERFFLGCTFEDSLLTGFFKGDIAEVLVFDSELSFAKHSSIESYLAIKYGICLYADYYNPDGEIIWSGTGNGQYTSNVFAIGREDSYGLYQKQSASAESSVLAVSAGGFANDNESNLADLPQNAYLFFADNRFVSNEGLSIENGEEGSYFTSKKRWKASAVGKNIYRTPLSMRVNPLEIFDTIPGDFCLILDENHDGNFSGITVILPDSLVEDSNAYFGGLNLCTSTDDTAYFTFAQRSALSADIDYFPPACESSFGKAMVKIVGGIPPFTYKLADKEGNTVKEWTSQFSQETIDSLSIGEYTLNITDIAANRYALETGSNLQTKTPDFGLKTIYYYEGTPLAFNLCQATGFAIDSCLWLREGEPISDSCQLHLCEEGTYSVEVTTSGCQLTRQFYISDATSGKDTTSTITRLDIKDQVVIVPNPALTKFNVYIDLKKEQNLTVYITDARGTVVEKQELKNIDEYIYSGEIKTPGVYLVTILSENKTLFSGKLIIQ